MTAYKLGMPTLIEMDGLDANVALCLELGLSFVELNMNLPEYAPGRLAADELRARCDETGVGFTLHLPEELDLAPFNRHIRAGHLACAKEAITWAGEVGISTATMHVASGVYFTLPDRRAWLYEKYRGVFLANLDTSFRELLAVARAHGVTLCLENCGPMFAEGFIREAVEHLLALDEKCIQLTWDLGHDADTGFANRQFFEGHVDRIGHMHLHDSNGMNSHRVLFSGIVDIPAALETARQLDIGVVIETKTVKALAESVRLLRERCQS